MCALSLGDAVAYSVNILVGRDVENITISEKSLKYYGQDIQTIERKGKGDQRFHCLLSSRYVKSDTVFLDHISR